MDVDGSERRTGGRGRDGDVANCGGGRLPARRPAAPGATIQGVVGDSRPRPPRALRVTFDQKVCGAELPDQSVVVDGGGRLANAVVTLVGVKARAPAREIAC